MALRLRITSATGVVREVLPKPGEAIQIQPGDRVVVIEPERADLVLTRVEGNLIVQVDGETYVLAGFFSAPAPLTLEGSALAAAPPLPAAPILEDQQGQPFTSEQITFQGGSTLIDSGPLLPENPVLPEKVPFAPPPGPPPASSGSGFSPPSGPGPLVQESPTPSSEVQGLLPTMVSVTSASAVEGGIIVFTITRTGSLGPGSIDFAFNDGTALQGLDYVGVQETLHFGAGEASKTVTATTVQDFLLE